MASFGKYLQEQLTLYSRELYRFREDEYWMLDNSKNMIALTPDLPLGIESIQTNYTINDYGTAGIYDSASTDIPLVDFQLSSGEYIPALIFITGARWNEFDLRKEITARNNNTFIPSISLVAEKNRLMSKWLTIREHETLLYGIPERNVYGLLNQQGVTTEDTSTATPNFYNQTNIEIYEFFQEIIAEFLLSAKLTNSSQISIKIPERLKRLFALPYSDTITTTLWEMLTDRSKAYYLGSVESATELEGTNLEEKGILPDATKDMIIMSVANSDTEGMKAHYFPREQTTPMKTSSLVYETVSYSAITSVYTKDKTLVQYVLIDNTPA